MNWKDCEICKKNFFNKKSHVRFCGKSCAAKYRISRRYGGIYRPPIDNICQFCKKTYKVHKCRESISKFCSILCHNKSNGKIVSRDRQGPNHPLWKGGKNLNVWRARCKKIYPHVCNVCKKDKVKLDVHHKDFNHFNNPLNGSNWEFLCRKCHTEKHSRSRNDKGQYI